MDPDGAELVWLVNLVETYVQQDGIGLMMTLNEIKLIIILWTSYALGVDVEQKLSHPNKQNELSLSKQNARRHLIELFKMKYYADNYADASIQINLLEMKQKYVLNMLYG